MPDRIFATRRAVADRLGIAHYVFDHARPVQGFGHGCFRRRIYGRPDTQFPACSAIWELNLPICCNCPGNWVPTVWRPVIMCAALRLRAAQNCTGRSTPRATRAISCLQTTQDQLDYLRFPLGDMPKTQVREIAEEMGLAVAFKPDSQDICFVPDGDYASVVRTLRPEADDDGEIAHIDGTIMGRHKGLIHYTVGQRKGLEIGGQAEPLYVIRLEPEAKRVIVGPKAALAVGSVSLRRHQLDRRRPMSARSRSRSARWAKPTHPPGWKGKSCNFTIRNLAWLRARQRSSITRNGYWAAAGSTAPQRLHNNG